MITHNLLGKCECGKCHRHTLKRPLRQQFNYYCYGKAAQPSNIPGLISAATPHILSPFNEHRGACSDAPQLPTALPGPTNFWPLTSHLSPMGCYHGDGQPFVAFLSNRHVYALTHLLCNLCISLSFACVSWNLLFSLLLLLFVFFCGGLTVKPGASVHLWFTSICGFSLIPIKK